MVIYGNIFCLITNNNDTNMCNKKVNYIEILSILLLSGLYAFPAP